MGYGATVNSSYLNFNIVSQLGAKCSLFVASLTFNISYLIVRGSLGFRDVFALQPFLSHLEL